MSRGRPRAVRARNAIPIALTALLFLTSGVPTAGAQSVRIGGFIKSSYYYDTQQVVSAREGDFLLYPALATDADDEANDTDNLLFFPFFSRLSLSVGDLPEALGAQVTGYIETDFFGPTNDELNTLRIRRAFARLDWGDREALFGMDWSPFFLSAWPRVIATETGAPFNPFARWPMMKLTLKPGNLRVSGILAQQRDAFQEIGGLKQQQQSGLPAAMLSLELVSGGNSIGLNSMIKWIRPTLTSDRFSTGVVQGFANLVAPGLAARANVTFGGDVADHLTTGGYAIVGEDAFEPLNVLAFWLDVETTSAFSVGLFGGYLQNLGTSESGLDPAAAVFAARGYGSDNAIEVVWRVAPRIAYTAGRFRMAFELQATSARYVVGTPGTIYDDSLAPTGDATQDVLNLRNNLSVFLTF